MPLSPSDRGLLELAIDKAIEQMRRFVRTMGGLTRELTIKDVAEYSYGFAQGYTLGIFIASHTPPLSKQDRAEAAGIIAKRGAEYREAIFKVG